MADKAYITPNVLKWARESARMSEEIASAKVSVSVTKLKEWEEGISQPTIRQAEILAKAYKRPFALLFLPEVPRDFQPLQDFRQKGSKELGTASVSIIREIQQKQAWIRDVYEENEEEKLLFVGKYSINDNPEIVAKDILKTLEINPADYRANNPIKEWIDKAESKGIFISRTSFIHSRLTLDSEEIQGFAIADAYAPFVFINSDDWNAPQLFTLVHELAHIWIAESGVSNDIELDIKNQDNQNPVEIFCNNVAANALAHIAFKKFLEKEREKELKKNITTSGSNAYLLLLNKNSRLFTQIVIDAFRGGHIEPTQASSLLNAPVNKFSSFEAILYR